MTSKQIVDIIVNEMDPDRIFIVGYRDKNRQRFNIFNGQDIGNFPSEVCYIDLLIVGTQSISTTTLKPQSSREKTIWKIETTLKGIVPNTVEIIAPGAFNRCLRKGFYFALRAVQSGYLVFVKENSELGELNYSALNDWKFESEKSALEIARLGDEFVKCALPYMSEKGDFQNLSLYFLQKAFDSYLRCAIKYLLGISLDIETDSQRLVSLARWTRPAIAKVLNRKTQQNQKIMNLLETHSHMPHNQKFPIESDVLHAVMDRVNSLRDTVLSFIGFTELFLPSELDRYLNHRANSNIISHV